MSLRLYWARNDGMSGHVFMSAREVSDLAREMAAQDMTGWFDLTSLENGSRVPPGQIDLALSKASPGPRTLEDAKLWHDWLRFLHGAAENGGLVVQ
jgi:hypothetical protein